MDGGMSAKYWLFASAYSTYFWKGILLLGKLQLIAVTDANCPQTLIPNSLKEYISIPMPIWDFFCVENWAWSYNNLISASSVCGSLSWASGSKLSFVHWKWLHNDEGFENKFDLKVQFSQFF